MKKAISLLLSLVMLFSITAGITIVTQAAYDTIGTAKALEYGTTYSGVIIPETNPKDFYKFSVSSAGKITFTATFENIECYYNKGFFSIYNSQGNCIQDYEAPNNDALGYAKTSESLYLSKGTYYFCISDHNIGGGSCNDGGEYTLRINYNCSIPTPSTLKVSTRNTTSLKLSWSKVSGASGYQLQQKSGDTYKTKKTTTSTSYTVSNLSAGKNYSFRVRAYKTVDGKKYYSGWKYLTTCAKPKTASLSKLIAYKSGHKIKAVWKKVGGTASGYQIYWAKDKSFKKVVAKTTVSGQSKTSYTGKNFTKGKKYYVRIRAYKTVNGTKYYGAWSNVKSITAK